MRVPAAALKIAQKYDILIICGMILCFLGKMVTSYDPEDAGITTIIPPKGTFEAFYPRGEALGSSRAAHSHGTFYKHRHPGLVDARNAAAYGFRFDGGRRFNYE